jgi:hypothetical protein
MASRVTMTRLIGDLSRLSDSRRRASRVWRDGQFSQSHFLVLKTM